MMLDRALERGRRPSFSIPRVNTRVGAVFGVDVVALDATAGAAPSGERSRESRLVARARRQRSSASLKAINTTSSMKCGNSWTPRDREGYCEPSSNYCANIWYR